MEASPAPCQTERKEIQCFHKAALLQQETKGISQSKCSRRSRRRALQNQKAPEPMHISAVKHTRLQYPPAGISKETSYNVFHGCRMGSSPEDKHVGRAVVVNRITISKQPP